MTVSPPVHNVAYLKVGAACEQRREAFRSSVFEPFIFTDIYIFCDSLAAAEQSNRIAVGSACSHLPALIEGEGGVGR